MKSLINVPNWINGESKDPIDAAWLNKRNPHNNQAISNFARSSFLDVDIAVQAAAEKFPCWASTTAVSRGELLYKIAHLMHENSNVLIECISRETGKSHKDAKGELRGAIMQARFFAGEGMRLYGQSLTSSVPGKISHTVRQPLGVAGLIIPANTPIANIAWKVFPALICGNTVVLKASEDAPHLAYLFAQLTNEAGLPAGVLNVIQGLGSEAGAALVENKMVSLISFTGSTAIGKWIAQNVGSRLARVSLELGGKNSIVICDDAKIPEALDWTIKSAFSNAGQRCAAASRILINKDIYEEFSTALIKRCNELVLGIEDECDLGPLISHSQRERILVSIKQAVNQGGKILCGGDVPKSPSLDNGYYLKPTLIGGLEGTSFLSQTEIFGPVATLHQIESLDHAISMANNTEYGLTSAIHTESVDRAIYFSRLVRAGVVNVNMGTFGSEPHMPFGGFGSSGNGTREPGVQALDVYSELKNISILSREQYI